MQKRAEVAASSRINVLTAHWPVSVGVTILVCGILLSLADCKQTHLGSGSKSEPCRCNSLLSASCNNLSAAEPAQQTWLLMLALSLRFILPLFARDRCHHRLLLAVSINGSVLRLLMTFTIVCLCFLHLLCGDMETNRGPAYVYDSSLMYNQGNRGVLPRTLTTPLCDNCVSTSAVLVFLGFLLLLCGDIEINPGPFSGNGQEWSSGSQGAYNAPNPGSTLRTHQNSYSNQRQSGEFNSQDYGHEGHYEGYHYDRRGSFDQFSHILEQAVVRMEKSNSQQGKIIEKRLKSMKEKIDKRMRDLETHQEELGHSLKELHKQNESMRA